jgi:hypothetical protein
MGDDDAPTGIAPTQLAEAPDEHTAWSLDDGEDWEPPRRSWRPVILAVVASLFVVGVAGGIAAEHLRPEPVAIVADTPVRAAPEPEPTAVPKPTPTTPMPRAGWREGSPNAQTMRPPPPPKPVIVDYDANLLHNLRTSGWVIWNDAALVKQAHAICGALRDGSHPDVVWQVFDAQTDYSAADSRFLVEESMLTYPNCP